jgi:hypothetical protein
MAAEMITAIVDGVEKGVDQVADKIRQATQDQADDPCNAEIQTRGVINRDLRPPTNRAIRGANARAVDGPRAVNRSIARLGRPTSGVQGGNRWGQWAREHVVNDQEFLTLAMVLGGPIAAAVAAGSIDTFLADRTPNGGPSAQARGLQIGAGAFLWAGAGRPALYHMQRGTLTGPGARQAWIDWQAFQWQSVNPTKYPSWRGDLAVLTGRVDWSPGDPVLPSSVIGRALDVEAQATALADGAGEQCRIQRDANRANAVALAESWIESQRTQGIAELVRSAAPLAAVVVGGIILGRSLK